MLTEKDIAELEAEFRLFDLKRAGGTMVANVSTPEDSFAAGIGLKLEVPRVVSVGKINGREATLEAVPTELAALKKDRKDIFARTLRIELTRPDCNAQCMIVSFANPVLVRESGIFMRAPQGKGVQRFNGSAWQSFDLWSVFNNSKSAQKERKALRVSIK